MSAATASAWDEAHELVNAAWRAKIIHRGAPYDVLETLLLNGQGSRRSIWVMMSIPSIATASRGLSSRTVRRAIDALIAARLVSVAVRGDGRMITTYSVDVQRLRQIQEANP